MKTFRAFLIKFIFVGVFTFSIYSLFQNASISRLFLITLIISAITFIGDLVILPRMNQVLAAIGDVIGLFVLYLILGNIFFDNMIPIVLPAFAAALFVGACEAFFHMYMMEKVHEEPRVGPSIGSLQVEISEELNPKELEKIREYEQEDK